MKDNEFEVPVRVNTGGRNHYIGIIHKGKLFPKTFRNPEKFPEDLKAAFEYAKFLRERDNQYCSYPVIIKEILESDFTPKKEFTPKFRNSQEAFLDAIQEGRLSKNPSDENFVGNYMYMYTDEKGKDHFKHINTREYLP